MTQPRLWILTIKKRTTVRGWATTFRSAATLSGYCMVLVEKDPKIPKYDKVFKDTEADKEKE